MIHYRKHGKERFAGQTGASHRLAIGFNSGTPEKPFFGKLTGWCIFQNSEGPEGYPIDYGLMYDLIKANTERDPDALADWCRALDTLKIPHDGDAVTLPIVRQALNAARDLQMKAPLGVFPRALEFVIPYRGHRTESGWDIKSVYDDAYVAMKVGGCRGEFCRGDGIKAMRWQPDGSRREMDCHPVGKLGVEPDKFCPYSERQPMRNADGTEKRDKKGNVVTFTPCNALGRLTVILAKRTADGRLVQLARNTDTRFEFTTRSERNQLYIASTLIELCARLDGQIDGIVGTLMFQIRRGLMPMGNLDQIQGVKIIINEASVKAKQERMAGKLLAGPVAPPLQLAASDDSLAPSADEPPPIVPKQEEPGIEDAEFSEDQVPETTADQLSDDFFGGEPAAEPPEEPADAIAGKIARLRELCELRGPEIALPATEILKRHTAGRRSGKPFEGFTSFDGFEAAIRDNQKTGEPYLDKLIATLDAKIKAGV